MTQTPHLALDYLQPEQAQKHVTINDALRRLDGLVQLSIIDRTHATPPTEPENGARYIVAASPTDAWADEAGKLALFEDTAWHFFAPQKGWRIWDEATAELLVYNGTDWQSVGAGGASYFGTVKQLVAFPNPTFLTIPSHVTLLGVAATIVTPIEGVQSWSLGVADSLTQFGNNLPLTTDSEIIGPTTPQVLWQNTPVVMTPSGGAFTAGQVVVAAYYIKLPMPEID